MIGSLTPKTERDTALANRKGFIGLSAYREEQAAFFYGRQKEIEALTNLIKTSSLTLMFGKSGTGKTSLLNAGVFPLLRKNYCIPFRIRLEFLENSTDIITQVKQVIKTEIDKYGFNVQAYPGNETLWEYFHTEELWKIVTPILVFDQFEELFTLAVKNPKFNRAAIAAFIEELSDVIENSVPVKLQQVYLSKTNSLRYDYSQQRVKIIFSFREDFLPEFESLAAEIPSIKNSRFRLKPMNGHQAFDVITKTWGHVIHPEEARKIVYYLTSDVPGDNKNPSIRETLDFDTIAIEPSLLSQVCAFIERERKKEGVTVISANFLKNYPKQIILRDLYNEVLLGGTQQIGNSNTQKADSDFNPVRTFIEENLITDDGLRTQYILHKIDKAILPGIIFLIQRYYLREEGETIELTHDGIIDLVKHDREQRRKVIALAEAKRKANRKAIIVIILAILAGIAFYYWSTKQARDKNEALITENEQLANSITAKLDSIKITDSILRGMGGNNSSGRPFPKTINGNNVDSSLASSTNLKDSLMKQQDQISKLQDSLIKNRENYRTDLGKYISERDELKRKLDLAGNQVPRVSPPLNPASENDRQEIESVKSAYANFKVISVNEIARLNTQITQLEFLLRGKQNMPAMGVPARPNEVSKLKARIADLERMLGRFMPINPKPGKKSKNYGYGYDYATDKVKN